MLLLSHVIKGVHSENLETPSQIAEATCLPSNIVNLLLKDAQDRRLVEIIGQADRGLAALAEMRYALTRAGREWAAEAMKQSGYFGPAPVSFDTYCERIMLQRITNERVSRPRMQTAFANLVIPDRFISRLGPAINSGTAILIYGPSGNGKTTIATIVGQIFQNVIYVPHCFVVDGQIIKVFDPSVHKTIAVESAVAEDVPRGFRHERLDKRWVPCYRPIVITGGELTLDMLDLKFNELAKYYEAPMHIKALNGTFLIDDFGRQRVKPEEILNRWIVPLNSRVDYLNLHTGKSIQLPFDELVIFSTNLHPNELMDPAFQRRISYKLETVEPYLERPIAEDLGRKMVFLAGARQVGKTTLARHLLAASGEGRFPRAIPGTVGPGPPALAEGAARPFLSGGRPRSGGRARSLVAPAFGGHAARSRGVATFTERLARGSGSQPSRRDPLDGHSRPSLLRRPRSAIRQHTRARPAQNAESVPLGLDAGGGTRTAFRKSRRASFAEVLPPSGGSGWFRHESVLSAGSGRPRGGLPDSQRTKTVDRSGSQSGTAVDPALLYFQDRLRIPFVYQVVLDGTRDFVDRGIRCLPAADFLSSLV